MTCTRCGAQNRSAARFCASCGASLGVTCPACGVEAPAGARFCDSCGHALAPIPGAMATGEAAGAPTTVGGGRYRLGRLLGSGARKHVYHARDSRLGRDVAVALLHGPLDGDALERFKKEAAALAGMGEHPNLVTVYDAGEEAGLPWVASQLMPGGTAADLLARAPDARLDPRRAAAIGADVAAALAHVHGRGLIHRDVKAANVWLSEDGSAVLGDFGLATLSGGHAATAGTVTALAPEVVLGGPAAEGADLYALGILLYELVTGAPPFKGEDAAAILAQHAASPAPPLSWLVDDVPGALEEIVSALLAKEAAERPTATEAVELLHAAERVRAVLDAAPPPQAGGFRSPFVGRVTELGRLQAALGPALAGNGQLVLLTGEPGIGKTRTAEELAAAARRAGAEVLWGRCHEGEAVVPYLPFTEPLRTWSVARSDERLGAMLAGAERVAALVPELSARLPHLAEATSDTGGEEERYRLFEAVADTLVRSAMETPLLLILDDLHWADRASLLLMLHLSRRIGDAAILILGTYRDVEVGRRHPLGGVLDELRREQLATRVVLRGLEPDELLVMLEASAGHELGGGGRRFAEELHQRTEGNPFFVEEVVRDLLEAGAIYQVDGRWMRRPLRELGIPEGVRQVIGRRLSRLSSEGNVALADAAVLGRAFSFDVLAAMGPHDRDVLGAHLEEAVAANLVVSTGTPAQPTYAFTHALVRETLYEELPLPKVQRRHLAAARAIEQVHAAAAESHAAELAAHFRAAGAAVDPEVTIGWCLRAAENAAGVFAWEETTNHLEAALELLEESGAEPAVRARMQERLGDLHYVSGERQDDGIAHLEQALSTYERLDDIEHAARVHSRLGRGLSTFRETMDTERALEHFRAALAHLEERPESLALAYALAGMAAAAIWAQLPDEGAAAGDTAARIARANGNEPLWAMASSSRAWHLQMLGQPDHASGLLEDAGPIAREANHSFAAFQWAWVASGLAFGRLDYARGAEFARRELEHPRTAQAPHQRATLRSVLAMCLFEMGDLAECAELVEKGVDMPLASVRPHFGRGEWPEAERILDGELAHARRAGNRWMQFGVEEFLARVHEQAGRLEDAAVHLAAAATATDGALWPATAIWSAAEHARVLAALGRLEASREQLEIAERNLLDGGDWRGLNGIVLLARGALAAAVGDEGVAAQALSDAKAILERHQAFWHLVALHRTEGLWRLARGERAVAAASFEAALALLRQAGAGPPWQTQFHTLVLRARGIDANVPTEASVELVAASVADHHPDLRTHVAPDGTLTMLFTDIEDSTTLAERVGDHRWVEVIREHNATVRRAVAEHGGHEVKSLGDGFMVVFPSAVRALRAARAIRDAGPRISTEGDRALQIRVGVHTGEPIAEGGDFYGSQVNFAARIAAEAGGGEILVSDLTRRLVTGASDLRFGPDRQVELKGFSGQHAVAELL